MKLKLKNFCCHTNLSIDIDDTGLTSVSGDSGIGKSTIFSAIIWTLYGKIPDKAKPVTWGKNMCEVELTYRGMIITRKYGPANLKVVVEVDAEGNEDVDLKSDGVEYQGDAAQSIIDSMMGMNHKEFLAAAYIIQRSNCSILTMTAKDQLLLLETISNSNASVKKARVKEKIKEKTDSIILLQKEIEVRKGQLFEIEKAVKPKDSRGSKEVKAELLSYENKLKAVQKESEALGAKCEKIRTDNKDAIENQKKIDTLKIEIAKLKEMKKAIGKEPKEEDITYYREENKRLFVLLECYNTVLSYEKDAQDIEDRLKDHYEELDTRLEDLKKGLLSEEKIEDLKHRLDKATEEKKVYDTTIIRNEEIKKRKESADKIVSSTLIKAKKQFDGDFAFKINRSDEKAPQKLLELLMSIREDLHSKLTVPHPCPNCSKLLKLVLNKLIMVDDDSESIDPEEDVRSQISDQISQIESLIRNIERCIPDYDAELEELIKPEEDAEELQKQYLRAKQSVEIYKTSSKRVVPANIMKLQKELKIKEEEYKENVLSVTDEIREEGLAEKVKSIETTSKANKGKIFTLTTQKKQHESMNKTIKEKEIALTTAKAIIKDGGDSIKTLKSLEGKLSDLNRNIIDINNSITNARSILDEVVAYELFLSKKRELKDMNSEIAAVEKNLADQDIMLQALYKLDGMVKEAEILSLQQTINVINEHAKVYLDQMFDEPISVRLSCIKHLKSKNKDTLAMNTVVEFRDATFPNIKELSWGEKQRCDMAFLLAVNDLFKSPIIILDECLNNLDSERNTNALTILKGLCSGSKLILVVAHEAVKGIFDHEIEL